MLCCAWRIWEWQKERMYLKFSLTVCVCVPYSCFCASSQAQKRLLGPKRARRLGRVHRITQHLLHFSALLMEEHFFLDGHHSCSCVWPRPGCARHTHKIKNCKEYALKRVEMKKITLIWKSLYALARTCSLFEMYLKTYGSASFIFYQDSIQEQWWQP